MKKFSFLLILLMFLTEGLFAEGLFAKRSIPNDQVEIQKNERKSALVNLKCEYLTNPLGIDVSNPDFSWEINSAIHGETQVAYQLIVASSPELLSKNVGDVWDTNKVTDANSINRTYAGKPLESGTTYYWKVRVWNSQDQVSPWSTPALWSTGLMNPQDWKAKWITYDAANSTSMPLFRTHFMAKSNVKRAMIYLSGLGYSELYLNGNKVGDHVLDPVQTNYDNYALYDTYDIKDQLKKGKNTIGVMLADGWYNQNKAGGADFSYGKPKMICQLQLEYDNGEKETIVSDGSWEWAEGPVISANVYVGETYDACREIKDWSEPECNSGNWKPVIVASSFPPSLKAQMLPPIKKRKEIQITKYYKIRDGKYVFDLGQNFSGWNRIRVKQAKGDTIRVRMCEEVHPDGTLDFTSTGVYYTRYEQTDTYICAGKGIETWEPRFTYHGFRYVEVSGLRNEPDKQTVKGEVVFSSVPQAGSFSCSDEQINRLHKLAAWTLTSNMHGMLTDCPHREKCGWTGDAHTAAPMSIYNFDMEAFWIKYLYDIRSSAARNVEKPGIPYMINPGKRECGIATPDWGTALVQIPWDLYLYYGNTSILKTFYPDMKVWVSYVENLSKDNIVNEGLGDWCPPRGNDTMDCPPKLSSTAFHYFDLTIMEQAAKIFKKSEDEAYYQLTRKKVKQAFIHNFYDWNKHSFGSQTANSLALCFQLTPLGEEKAVSNAIAKDATDNYSGFCHTGIFGLPRIFRALTEQGNDTSAYHILTGKGKISFDNMWKIYGATTLWETLPVENLPDSLNKWSIEGSHNHPMQGGFDAWFYNGIAGIAPMPDDPGFRTICFKPYLINQLKWAEASYHSKYGIIKSSWKWNKNLFTWNITIPANAEGLVYLPISNYSSLLINGKKVDRSMLQDADASGEYTKVLRMKSGYYKIEVIKNKN